MKKTIPVLFMLGAAVLVPVATIAVDLTVTESDIANLGIEISTPQTAEHLANFEARARVVLPPNAEILVTTTQPGVFVRQYITSGEEVTKGQLVAEIRSSEFIALQREYLDSAIEHDLAQQHLLRDRQLYEEGIISQRRLQQTRATANAAAARLQANRQMLRFTGLSDKEMESLASRYTLHPVLPVRSPITGVVLESMAAVGEHIEVMSGLFRLGDLSTLNLDIQVPEQHLDKVASGMSVLVSSRLGEVRGEILNISRAVDPHSQTALARAELVDATDLLRPGQFVTVRIGAAQKPSSVKTILSVPNTAVVRSNQSSYVFVRTETGFVARQIRLIGSDHERSLIAGGISADSKIAINGVAALKALWTSPDGEGN